MKGGASVWCWLFPPIHVETREKYSLSSTTFDMLFLIVCGQAFWLRSVLIVGKLAERRLMTGAFEQPLSAQLHNLTAKLRSLDQSLKANPKVDTTALSEFRQALDNVRLTAWSVSELLKVRQSQGNVEAVISFVTAERLRRFSQIARDLLSDLEQHRTSWPAEAVRELEDSLALLGARLTTVSRKPSRETM